MLKAIITDEGSFVPIQANAIASDRQFFFSKVFDQTISVKELIIFFLDYKGILYSDQTNVFVDALSRKLYGKINRLLHNDVFNKEMELTERILDHYARDRPDYYFDAGDISAFHAQTILPESHFAFTDDALPNKINQRSSRKTRAALLTFSRNGGELFIAPNGYQYFDRKDRIYWPQASSRSFSEFALDMPYSPALEGCSVLVQDYGDGSNFAHFTFDWLTRIGLLIENGTIDPCRTNFIFGGSPGVYHQELLRALIKVYGIPRKSILYPSGPSMHKIEGKFVFFSDAKLTPLHPAQMAHPRSLSVLKRLTDAVSCDGKPSGKKVFISRGDAKLRRIANESDLIALAKARGYDIIEMSQYSFEDQVTLFSNADIVVGAHGMAFTYLVFSRKKQRLCELFHPILGTDAYRLMSRSLGSDHDFLVGTSLEDNHASYQIDLNAFVCLLDKCERSEQ